MHRVTLGVCVLAALILMAGQAGGEPPKGAALLEELGKQVAASDKLSDKMKAFVKAELLPLCTNPVFVKEVQAQNAKKVSLEEIKKIDGQWLKAEEELPIQKEKMNNACAAEIKRLAAKLPALGETFVMDDQGANVGQNALTSDYWQGDEDKWSKSYNGGKGGLDVGKLVLDKSTDTVDQKVSLPIIDEEGKVIGAVCFGVKANAL